MLGEQNAVAGACINLGGDLRVFGRAPEDAPAWAVGLDQPNDPDNVMMVVGLADGALATSSTTRRRWQGDDGVVRHHLIDPLQVNQQTRLAGFETIMVVVLARFIPVELIGHKSGKVAAQESSSQRRGRQAVFDDVVKSAEERDVQ